MLNLYTETIFQPIPPTPASLIKFQIPRKNGSYDKSRVSLKQNKDEGGKSEKSFSRDYLASQSSFYFRQNKTYPRTFLWKVYQDERVLQVQCADVARSETDLKEAYLILEFEFQDAIISGGITFADLSNGEELFLFVCTKRNEIFNLCIPITTFRNSEAISKHAEKWCLPLDISSLSIETVYRIYASTPLELFISYTSGKLQRLTRKSKDEHWTPTNYDEKTWGASIRGMVSRRGLHTVNSEGLPLDTRAIQDMVISIDGTHLFTACLNHQLRVWNLPNGRLALVKDLLDRPREVHDRLSLNPADHGILQLVKFSTSKNSLLITYSHQDGGQFKFWDVKGGLTDQMVIEDKYPGVKLNPPDPDPSGNTIWSLTEFKVSISNAANDLQLWTSWRNNNYHQLYTVTLQLKDIKASWDTQWVKCTSTNSIKPTTPDLVKYDSEDISSKWIDFFFFPGRYTEAVLDTALSVYQEATFNDSFQDQSKGTLVQRLCDSISATVTLRKYADSDLDYDRFVADTDHQWRTLWRIAESLNDKRFAPLSISFDSFNSMVWIAMADNCCAVRENSKLELLRYNQSHITQELVERTTTYWPYRKIAAAQDSLDRLSCLIHALADFRQSFPAELVTNLSMTMDYQISEIDKISPYAIFEMYDSVNFADAFTNDSFDSLEKHLEPIDGFTGLNNDLISSFLDCLMSHRKKTKTALRNTLFASQLISAGILETLSSQRQAVWDLMAFIIFVEGEFNQGEDKLDDFDTLGIFQRLAFILKILNRSLWLSTHTRRVPLEFAGSGDRSHTGRLQNNGQLESLRIVTILEDVLGQDVRPQPAVDRPMTFLITDFLADFQSWISGQDAISPEEGTVYLLCDLISNNDLDLATEFLRFQPSTSWATYVQGRLYLAKEQFDFAAQSFDKCAYDLACGRAIGDLNELSAGLLSNSDLNSFNNGLPHYFQHIMSLFETSQAFSYAAYFARKALLKLKKHSKDPVHGFRSDILSQLFTLELKTNQFEQAFEALIEFTDESLRKSSTEAIVNSILHPTDSVSGSKVAFDVLQNLPWSQHPRLEYFVDQHLSSLAAKQKTVALSSNQWITSDGNVDYLQVLYALRIAQNDFRSAVSVLYRRLRLIQRSAQVRNDPNATALRHGYLALINTLTCVARDEAYILIEAEADQKHSMTNGTLQNSSADATQPQRPTRRHKMIITLDDLRIEYQQILDKCSRIERGDFDFGMNNDTEDEDEDDGNGGQYEQDLVHSRLNGVGNDRDAMEM